MLEDFRANFLNRANPYASLVISQLFVCIHGSIYLTNGSMLPFVCSVQLLVIDHRWRQYGYRWKSGTRAAGKCCVTDLYTTLFNRFIRFKQWRARFKKKRQLALYRLLSVLGLVQVFSKSHCTLRFVSTSPFLLYLTCEQFFPRAFQGLAQRRMNCPKNV